MRFSSAGPAAACAHARRCTLSAPHLESPGHVAVQIVLAGRDKADICRAVVFRVMVHVINEVLARRALVRAVRQRDRAAQRKAAMLARVPTAWLHIHVPAWVGLAFPALGIADFPKLALSRCFKSFVFFVCVFLAGPTIYAN